VLRVGVLAFFICVFLWVGRPALAQSDESDIVWSGPLSQSAMFPSCSGEIREVQLASEERRTLCLYGDSGRLSIGSYYDQSGAARYAVSVGADERFYPINVCAGVWGCVYSASADTLFRPSPQGITVFAKISEKIQWSSGTKTFSYPAASPIYLEPNSWNAIHPKQMPVLSLSPNGSWMVATRGQATFVVVEVATLALSDVRGSMGGGVTFAIHDDGRTLAMVGRDMSAYILTTHQGASQCEYDPRPDVVRPCTQFYLQPLSSFLEDSVVYARFLPDSTSLFIQVVDSQGVVRHAATRLRVAPASGGVVRYLALGDSYTSGEGETSDGYYRNLTDTRFEKCHQSTRSYPFLVGVSLSTTTRSVACSGATTRDIVSQDAYNGQGNRLVDGVWALTPSQVQSAQADALIHFTPGRVPQRAFVEAYSPETVSVGIGGNDAGLMARLSSCIMPGTCSWASTTLNRQKTAKEIHALYDRFLRTFRSLREASPRSRMVVIGYPSVISTTQNCSSSLGIFLNDIERRYMDETIRYLNKVLQVAASRAGFGFISTEEAFMNRKLCQTGVPPAMNALRFGDDVGPIAMLPGVKIIGAESFHPTPYGHYLVASKVSSALSQNTLNACSECQNDNELLPGSYWGAFSDILAAPRIVSQGDIASAVSNAGDEVELKINEGVFRPNSPVVVDVHSESQRIGQLTADEKGQVQGYVSLPSTLSPGFHTVFASGISHTGEDVVAYQTLYVTGYEEYVKADEPKAATALVDDSGTDTPSVLSTSHHSTPEDGPVHITHTPAKASQDRRFLPVFPIAVVTIVCFLVTGYVYARYNSPMNIRRIVKKLIPTTLFAKIEPTGHLIEAVLANIRYGFPGRRLHVIGVTGTNGKTTTSFLIHRMLHEAGIPVAITTTVGYGVGYNIISQQEHITTAQAGVLQRRLRDFARAGARWVVVETSSHSLAQHRIWGVPYEIAVMTNVTHDHIEYHRTFARYRDAKRRLFSIANRRGLRFGVINADDPSAARFKSAIKNSVTYGLQKGGLRATSVDLRPDYSTFIASIENDKYALRVNIPGEFNVSNALAAVAVGRELELSKEDIEKGIAALQSVEGRMNVIDEGQEFKVIVDFASTPDGFEKFFASVRPLTKGKLIAVFGSAGRRDEKKRAAQGEIAGKYADIVIATEEDDRDEPGADILKQIVHGAKKAGKKEGKNIYVEPSREKAIGFAFTLATSPKDVVVLLGKGHEKTIERADGSYPWSDSEVARTALRAMLTETENL